jgi:hypothetical protein
VLRSPARARSVEVPRGANLLRFPGGVVLWKSHRELPVSLQKAWSGHA